MRGSDRRSDRKKERKEGVLEGKKALEERIDHLLQEVRKDSPAEALEELKALAISHGGLLARRLKRWGTEPLLALMGSWDPRSWQEPLRELARDEELEAPVRIRALELLAEAGEPVDRGQLELLGQEERLFQEIGAWLEKGPEEALPQGLIASLGALPAPRPARIIGRLTRHFKERGFPFLEGLVHQGLIRRPEEARAPDRPVGEATAEILMAALEALGTLALPEAAQLLEEVARSAEDKAWQKEARRSLYRLKSLHPEMEIPTFTREVRTLFAPPERKVLKAMASFIDGAGHRLFLLAKALPMGKVRNAFLVGDDRQGIVSCQVFEVPKKSLPEVVEKFTRKDPWIDLDPGYWRALIEELRQQNARTHLPIPEGYFMAVADLEEPPSSLNPMIYQELNEETLRSNPYFLSRSPRLFEVQELAGWLFSPDQMGKYLQELRQVEQGMIIVSPTLKKEREEEVYARTVQELFDPETRATYRRRLEEMAYFLWRTQRKEEAELALAAALGLEQLEGERIKEHPWAREMVHRSFELAQERGGREATSLIVVPEVSPLIVPPGR
ncbi:MAG: hypothetical protein HYY20_13620 [Candidatus Tectomicrobia bacterium]|uniref:HEAT repeat domain-containing protein n=1 Tax=Tectimicrobiota bacterium TaxID=2528274 RepID=A0A932CRF4_UNCTE|nr:hypothetical protein [Candidatus Tectomicrobia bacterium]